MKNKNLVLSPVIGIITCLGLLVTGCTTPGTIKLVGGDSVAPAANSVVNVPANQITSGLTSGATAPSTVALGAAASFGSLGGNAGITNQGLLTVINGDIGITGAATKITGFRDSGGTNYTTTPLNNGMVNGRIYTADEGKQALADARTAFNSLSPSSLPGGTDPGAGQLGGLTLTPGVYKAALGSFLITGADLTLDAQGNSNAVFVFQMASSLTVGAPGAPRTVNLINGAQAKNVFWQVGSAATINPAGGGTMVGTIISYASTTFSTAGNAAVVTLNGRALALNASSTMVNTIINVPGNNSFGNQIATGSSGNTSHGPVALGAAGNFVILAKSGISTTGTTVIKGDIGVSPAAATYITGFGLVADALNVFSKSSLVTGNIYASNYAPPAPANMTTAVNNMETAYTDAAGRTGPNATELYAGDISGVTFVPGIYKWSSGVLINKSLTLTGSANDVWIFQIAQNLTVGNGAVVTLSGGAQPNNIFWQVAGNTTLGTTANFKGNILCKTSISMQTGATLTGRALAQTAVTLDATSVTSP